MAPPEIKSIPGAVVAVTLWVPSTLLLRFYQEHFSSSRIYGQLNAVATLLLWLYLTGAAIFIGGEANSEIEKAAEAGHPDVRGPGNDEAVASAVQTGSMAPPVGIKYVRFT
jgi:uncharacterized BrkB/YihY/UPF0761 family membrane protein